MAEFGPSRVTRYCQTLVMLLSCPCPDPPSSRVADPEENELLLPPHLRFEVIATFPSGNGLVLVQCRQLDSLHPLIDMTPPPSVRPRH